jgi:3-hydroxyacyl-[acyl-carrier-protein] dehydratase
MSFTFVDRIVDLQPGVKITTVKCLSLGEEYLADHFPRFPVMPGVLMLEAMTEAGAWLVRASDDFSHSIVTLKEARNVIFADFVQPGRILTVTAEIVQFDARDVELKAHGRAGDNIAVRGRLVLERRNLADTQPDRAPTDEYLKRDLRAKFALIYQPQLDADALDEATLIAASGAPTRPTRGKG